MSYNLSDLLEKKSFDLLTADERSFVLSSLSAEDYKQQRATILALKQTLKREEEMLVPVFPSAAMAALKERSVQEKKKGIWFIFAHKTPTWAAVAAGFILYFLISQVSFNSTKATTLQLAQDIDTVYIQKYIRSVKPSILPKDTLMVVNTEVTTQYKQQEPKPDPVTEKPIIIYTDEMLNAGSVNYSSILSNRNTTKGVSLRGDSLSQWVNNAVY